MAAYRSTFWPTADSRKPTAPRAFTLVEMLIAMAITLVMMAAVVTLFANVSNSVRNRRATIEMTSQVRHLRNVLQQDLQGATCPGLTWQRPESNHGYIELIEGIHSDQNPTPLVRDTSTPPDGIPDEWDIDPALSPIPRNNIGADADGNGKITNQELEAYYQKAESFIPGGLGDYDDILMLTSRNEHEPFIGRMPINVRLNANTAEPFNVNDANDATKAWGYDTIESPLAEVVWFAIENPSDDANNFFGEPGMRTVYRRALLIAPWLNPYRRLDNNGKELPFRHGGDTFMAEPGLLRMLPKDIDLEEAIAAIIAFQDRYDLSVRLEWDHNIGSAGRWKIMANTLGDLTKRENRFGHFGFLRGSGASNPPRRIYPYPLVSYGSGYSGNKVDVEFVADPDVGGPSNDAKAEANLQDAPAPGTLKGLVVSYTNLPANISDSNRYYAVRPFAYVDATPDEVPSTAQAMLNDDGAVVRVVHGPVPLWGPRRGQDVMMSNVLGFDVRVYDPGAPLYGRRDDLTNANSSLTVLQPSDPGWKLAYLSDIGLAKTGFEFVGQGAYVDMGYAFGAASLPTVPSGTSWTVPWFAEPRGLSDVFGVLLAPGYSVYDTWSFHYENNGRDDDDNDTIDQGTNGLDDVGSYWDPATLKFVPDTRHGPDDVGERETVPPYDKPLRGMQVLIRTYEPDSRAIRQVRVNQHFMPE